MDSTRSLPRWIDRVPRPRFTLRGLIYAVAVAAVFSALFTSLWREGPSPVSGLVLVVGSIGVMAMIRAAGAIRREREAGRSPSAARVGGIVLSSIGVAALIVLGSDFTFLVVHRFFRDLRRGTHTPRYHINEEGVCLGIVLALWVAHRLREALWLPIREAQADRPRQWTRLWPLAMVALFIAGVGYEALWERYSFARMKAEYHAGLAEIVKDPKSAAWHERMRRVY